MFGGKYRGDRAEENWRSIEDALDARFPRLQGESDAALGHGHWPARQSLGEFIPVVLGYEYNSWECDALHGFLLVISQKRQKNRWLPDETTIDRMAYRALRAKAEYLVAMSIASYLFRADRERTTEQVLEDIPVTLDATDVTLREAEVEAFQPTWQQIRSRTDPPSPTKAQLEHEVLQEIAREFGYRMR